VKQLAMVSAAMQLSAGDEASAQVNLVQVGRGGWQTPPIDWMESEYGADDEYEGEIVGALRVMEESDSENEIEMLEAELREDEAQRALLKGQLGDSDGDKRGCSNLGLEDEDDVKEQMQEVKRIKGEAWCQRALSEPTPGEGSSNQAHLQLLREMRSTGRLLKHRLVKRLSQ